MNKEFIPYEQALKLKELGFDEECLGYYNIDPSLKHVPFNPMPPFEHEWCLPAPLYQQAFRWFRENYNLFCEINIDKTMEPKFAYTIMEYESAQFFEGFNEDILSEYLYYKHEEAELACINKLIEIVKDGTKINT